MYIIVIGWIYVVLMMSVAEDTVVAGVMTFLFYGVLPVSILVYLGGSRRRRRQRQENTDSIVSAESAAASQEDGTDAPQVKPEVNEEEATPPHHPHPPS